MSIHGHAPSSSQLACLRGSKDNVQSRPLLVSCLGDDGAPLGGWPTLFVPLIDRVSLALSSVLHVSELGETCAGDSEELCSSSVLSTLISGK